MESSRLAAVPLFQALDPEDLDALAAVASEVVAVEGQTLAAEGDFGHALYAIESGTADVTHATGGTSGRSVRATSSARSPCSRPAAAPRRSSRRRR